MDFDTARRFLMAQTIAPVSGQTSFVDCLRQGIPPVPGQATSILLALKTLNQALKDEPHLERSLGHALFVLAYDSRELYRKGQQAGVEWPPLLEADLNRMAEAVRIIWANNA